ncbi:MAG: hypothetical protein VX641_02090 [Planctomycetota bacterium]|nr:hypothetical protein [Planctomycetota bacterium]
MNPESDHARDHALSILGENAVDPWGLPDPDTSTLMVAVAGNAEPSPQWIRDALEVQSDTGAPVRELDEVIEGPPFALWAVPLMLGEHPVPVIAWAERIEHSESLPEMARDATWMIGLQTVLDPHCPLEIWTRLAGLLLRTSPRILAMFDQETEQWFGEHEIQLHFLSPKPTTHEGMLFRVHATALSERPEEADSIWLHTEGLRRCGCPELEILELPARHLGVAHELLNALGSLFITRGVPAPGTRFEAGTGVSLMLNHWRESVDCLSEQSLGSAQHRIMLGGEADNPLLEAHAVVCGPDPLGTFRKVHVWPREAIEAIESGRAALERTPAWTSFRSVLARSLWPRFMELHASGRRMIACIAMDTAQDSRDHVWIEVSAATDSSIAGVIISETAGSTFPPGSTVEVEDLETLIDWYSPDQSDTPRGDS